MTNLARFTVNATPSTNRGFDATNGQALTFGLEAPSSLVQRWTLEVYTPSDTNAPLASKAAPLLTLVGGTSGQKVDSVTPASSITSTAPASGYHSYVVRSTVNGGADARGNPDPDLVFERIVAIRTPGGRRKIIASEGTQYAPGGWADAQNDDVDAVEGLAGSYVDPRRYGPLVSNSDGAAAANAATLDAAIVAANAASVALTGPCDVLIPAGKYSSARVTAKSNVRLRGEGMGRTTLRMPAGVFTNTTSQNYGATSVGISVLGELSGSYIPLTNFELSDLTLESEVSDGRYTYPILARNVSGLRVLRVEVFGIAAGNCITVDSVTDCEIAYCRLHDCTTASINSLQLSGIESDANRVNSTNCVGGWIHHNRIVNLTMTGAAFAATTPNMQTDGINLGLGNFPHGWNVHDNYIKGVGEAIDCFASECTIHSNELLDCNNVGLKFIHGASRNHAHGNNIARVGLAGIYLGGSDVAATEDNYIHDNTIHSVNLANAWTIGAAIRLDVGAQPYKPNRNTIARNKVTGDTSNLDFVIRQDDGTDNRYIDNEADGWAAGGKYSEISAGTATVVNAKKTLVRVGLSGTEATAASVEEIVPYADEEIDTQGEFDVATKTFTAKSHRRLSVQAVLRIISGAGEAWTLRIKKNGTIRAAVLSYSGGNPSQIRIHDTFNVVPGDTVAIYVFQNNGARDCGGGSDGSYLTIEEVAG